MQTTAVGKIRIGYSILCVCVCVCVYYLLNRFVMHCDAILGLAGLNESIEISFMLVGHTKFAPVTTSDLYLW